MAQDIRKLCRKKEGPTDHKLKTGHEKRFLERLENELPGRQKTVSFEKWRIVATVLLLFGVVGYHFLGSDDIKPVKTTVIDKNTHRTNESGTSISLGDLSPDLKKIENYYIANINLELSHLEVSEKNKALVDSFMDQLAELNDEYKKLNTELNEIGPNEQTITAMIKNLQLRLQLMHKLKEKLNQLKSSKNETITDASL